MNSTTDTSSVEMNSVNPVQTSSPVEDGAVAIIHEERRDEDHERSSNNNSPPLSSHASTYRAINYSNVRRRSDDNVWDQLMDLRLQSIEGRDDTEGTLAEGDDEEVIVHRNLLRRRHVRKVQKERAAAAAKLLATSPLQKRSPSRPAINTTTTTPTTAESGPCSFFNDCKPTHSPIRPPDGSAHALVVTSSGCDTMGHSTTASLSNSKKTKKTHSPSDPNNNKKCYYPKMSPVRCAKRRKLFSASRNADCTTTTSVMS
mmetsp:Transcript_17295/g.47247  ORF Transcript_17295/g.47247 Transcript_17295/m.47247 type:complete len:258 (-) Transcript_17295:109-882(-)